MGTDPLAVPIRAKWHPALIVGLTNITFLALVGCAPVPPARQDAYATPSLPSEAIPSTDAGQVSDPTEARQRALGESALARIAQRKAREAELRAQESALYVQDGYGLFVGVGGERYRGEIRAGKRDGYGVDIFSSGDRYEGQESENQKSGRGVYTSGKGDRYEGDFATDHSNGWGVYIWPDGRRYEGRFADDHPNGPGILTDATGTTHAGVWKDGTLIDLFAPPPTNRSSVGGKEEVAIKTLAVLTGLCRFRLITGFFPCDGKVAYAELENGRSVLTFIKGDVLFSVSGGRDRQPNLEDYYLGIDTIRMKRGSEEEAVDHGMEGECHFHMNKPATKFFDIKCDVYNRAKGSLYNFYLEKIQTFDRKVF